MTPKDYIEVSTEPISATIFNDRARIIRGGSISVPEGRSKVMLTGIPENLVEGSFRVKAKSSGRLTVLDVKTQKENYTTFPQENIEFMHKKVLEAEEALKMVDDQLAIIEKKRAFLNEISIHSSESISKDLEIKRPTISDWKNVLDFLGENHAQLDAQFLELQRQKREKNAILEKLSRDSSQLIHGFSRTRQVGWVILESDQQQEIYFEVEYQVKNVHWKPYYDVRVDTDLKKVVLRYQGEVVQRTGEDWKDMEIKLSTARPNVGGGLPTLSGWYVSQREEYYRNESMALSAPAPSPKGSGVSRSMKKAKIYAQLAEEDYDEMEEAKEEIAVVESGSGASVVFVVPGLSDVPGDGSVSRLLVMEGEFEAKFRYVTVPKLELLAYLEAEVTNSTDFPLLPGQMQVFRDGDFVGKSNLNELKTPGETFQLELGADESIRVKRKLEKSRGKEKGLFTKSRGQEYEIHISVENLRKTAENIIIRDQVPVSQDEVIKVKLEEIEPKENPAKNPDKLAAGVTEWAMQIAPGATQKCQMRISVEYPADFNIDGLE